MDNDKAFAIFALTLLLGMASVLTAVMTFTEGASLPSPLVFVEHVAMGLAIRAAYKGFGGFSWDDWSVLGDRVADARATEPASGITADATS